MKDILEGIKQDIIKDPKEWASGCVGYGLLIITVIVLAIGTLAQILK